MIAAVVLGLVIGLVLGSLGGGGSILAVPVLVFLAGQTPAQATTTSLVAVGASAVVGSIGHARAGRVRWDAAAVFVVVGIAGSWVGTQVNRALDGDALMLAFSGLVLVAAHRMLTACPSCTREGEEQVVAFTAAGAGSNGDGIPAARTSVVGPGSTGFDGPDPAGRGGPAVVVAAPRPRRSSVITSIVDDPRHAARVVLAGTTVGFLTGTFGVGGGFVVVPALTLVLGLSMPVAIGTSLVVVAGNAAIALALRGVGSVEWDVALPFTATMLVGSLLGGLVAHRLPARRSLQAFAALLVAVAAASGAASLVALAG